MRPEEHYIKLESMYSAAPINDFFLPKITVSEGESLIEIEVTEKLYHAAGAVHGSVYFKMLDDAAFFAASSLEKEVFLLTTSFTTYLTKPVSEGKMRAVGKVVNENKTQFIAESIVYNANNKEVGRGNGVFMRSKQLLAETKGYEWQYPSAGTR